MSRIYFSVCVSLLLRFASSQRENNTFVVTFPCTVHPGMDTKVSVSIVNAARDVNVTATFHSSARLRDKLSETVALVSSGQSRALTLRTPSPPSGSTPLFLSVSGSGGLVFTRNAPVSVGKRFSIFVQTDKGVYRPGQTIRMRVLAILPDLMPYKGRLNITVEDKDKNRLAQWTNAMLDQGVWMEDFPLSEYPALGNWTIKAEGPDSDTSVVVEVREYVLPKFEVTITPPAYVAKDELSSQPITVDVSAKYTYGKPVQGTGSVVLLLNFYQYCSRSPASKISRPFTLSKDGKASIIFSRGDFYKLFCSEANFQNYFRGYQKLLINVSVSDSVNGELRTTTRSVGLYSSRIQAKFDPAVSLNTFIPGTNYIARILVSTPDDKPLDSVTVHLKGTITTRNSTDSSGKLWPRYTYHYNNVKWAGMSVGGVVTHSLPIPLSTSSVYLYVTVGYSRTSTASISPQILSSPSKTYLSVRADKANYAPQETATFTAHATSPFKTLFYSVYARGRQVTQGTVAPGLSGKMAAFTAQITSSMAPNAKVVAYFVHSDGEIVVDSLSVTISNIFANNVRVSFSVAEARPNTKVTLSVGADNGSFVAVSVVDQSALLLRQSNDISAAGVTDEIARYDGARRPIFYDGPVWAFLERRRRKRLALRYPWYYGGTSAAGILRNAGVCIITDCNLPDSGGYMYSPGFEVDVPQFAFDAERASSERTTSNKVGQSLAVVDHTRDFFPETWVWNNKVSGSNGRADFQITVPDTITSWVASAFAVSSNTGLGVASTHAKLRAFQQFFISLNLPYSVIRGEELALQVNVFNYMKTAQETSISVAATNQLIVAGADTDKKGTKTITIAANGVASVFFTVIPRVTGYVAIAVTARSPSTADHVRRQLLVEAEGATKSYSRGVLIDLTATNTTTEHLQLSVPSNAVPGSARAIVSVIGDIMGPALANLDQLLKMPYGCGEQNMLNFAPDIFIIKYLTAIGQASSSIISKARRFMIAGYQRQLTYRRKDHSFSAFGNRDKTGSLWLTAFVTKSFAQASNYIYIDPNIIQLSLRYLVKNQRSDGSFPLIGMVHHRGLKGGIHGDIARTAYILTTLVEAQRNTRELETSRVAHAVMRARSYLEKSITSRTDNYTLAMSTYALQLAQSSHASKALQLLMSRADRTGGSVHWHDSRTVELKSESRWRPPWYRAPSADVELTAYGLLALIGSGNLPDSLLVAKWLSAQRNAYGGFDSTQDTVVALQALAELAERVNDTNPAMTINLRTRPERSPYIASFNFDISRDNFLVLQQITDTPVPSELFVSASGHGTALLSVQVFYNVKSDDVIAFNTTSDCDLWKWENVQQVGATCTFCTKLSPHGLIANAAGMSLLEIGLPSGFSADKASLDKTLNDVVKRYELPDRRVVLYIDELTSSGLCVKFDMLQDIFVSRLQATPLRTTNYYDPSLSSISLFSVSGQAIQLCCQCATCDGCSSFNQTSCSKIEKRQPEIETRQPEIETRQPPGSGTRNGRSVGLTFVWLCIFAMSLLV